jgi:hypothetical protein
MKNLLFIAILFSCIELFAQVKVARITKVEKLVAKDEYGKVKENFLKLKFTLSNGKTEIFEKNLVVNDWSLQGTETWTYLGLNYQEDAFVMTSYWDNGGPDNHYKVYFYEYRYDSKTKKYKLQKLEDGPDMPILGFRLDEGWTFGGLEYKYVTMFKDGYEWVIYTDVKSNGVRFINLSERGGD